MQCADESEELFPEPSNLDLEEPGAVVRRLLILPKTLAETGSVPKGSPPAPPPLLPAPKAMSKQWAVVKARGSAALVMLSVDTSDKDAETVKQEESEAVPPTKFSVGQTAAFQRACAAIEHESAAESEPRSGLGSGGLHQRLAERKSGSLRMVHSSLLSAYSKERRALEEERDALSPLAESYSGWKQLVGDLECAETEQAADLIQEEMKEVKARFGVAVTDPNPRLREIEEHLDRSAEHRRELMAQIRPPSVAPAASAQDATRWPKDVRWKRAVDAGWHPRQATKKLKSRLRAITHRATLAKERVEAKKRGELALVEAVERLEPKYVEHRIQQYPHIEEDAGNEKAKDSWQSKIQVPTWKQARYVGRTELCADAPWRHQKKDIPPKWSNVPPMHRPAGAPPWAAQYEGLERWALQHQVVREVAVVVVA